MLRVCGACIWKGLLFFGILRYIKISFPNGLMFRSIHVHEVHDLIKSLKNQKSTIGVPTKCVNYICEAMN